MKPPSNEAGKPKFAGFWLRCSPAVAPIAVLLYALSGDFDDGVSGLSVFALGVMIAAAALIAGALIGFLFGLPRTLDTPNGSLGAEPLPADRLKANTNLEQVSDWLTKILVGIGLIELGRIADGVDGIAATAADGLGNGNAAHPFVVGLLIYAAVDGFLVGYLWTRIAVFRRLAEAERFRGVASATGVLLRDSVAPLPDLPDTPGLPRANPDRRNPRG